MNKLLFWIGAIIALFKVAYPIIEQKREEYKQMFPKREDEDDDYQEAEDENNTLSPVGGIASPASMAPASVIGGSSLSANEAF